MIVEPLVMKLATDMGAFVSSADSKGNGVGKSRRSGLVH